jgi:hypothetical protein
LGATLSVIAAFAMPMMTKVERTNDYERER